MTDARSVSSCGSCDEARSWWLAALGGAPGVERPYGATAALTCTPCRYLGGRVPSEPFLETYLKRPNPRSFFCSHQGFMR